VSPEFYSASVLNSIPYKRDAIAMVGRLRHAFTLDSGVINGLLADSRLLMLFATGWDEFRSYPGGRKSITEFSSELEKRAMLAVKARTPFLLKLPLDAKSAFDSLLFDDQTADLLGNGYQNETRNVTYVEDKIRGIAKRVFPKSYFEQSGSIVVDMFIREIKSEFTFNTGTITPGSADQACRMLWGYLEIMDIRRDEDAFISTAKRWIEAQGLRSASPLYDFLRAQATRTMSVEKTAVLFRLLGQAKKIGLELGAMKDFQDFGISLIWAMRDCPIFMVSSVVEAQLSEIEKMSKTENVGEARRIYSVLGETVLNVHRYALSGGDLWSDSDGESWDTNGK
jgi:hypothetical protein